MFGLRDTSLDSMERLEQIIQHDQSLKVHRSSGEHCIYIQPHINHYDEGYEFVQQIYHWICHGEFPGLRVVNAFQRYDLNTLKICLDEKDSFYTCMVNCFEEYCHRSRPYED